MSKALIQHPATQEPEGPPLTAKGLGSLPWDPQIWDRKSLDGSGTEHYAPHFRPRASHRQILDTGTSVSSNSSDLWDSDDDPVEWFLDRLFDSPSSVFQSTKVSCIRYRLLDGDHQLQWPVFLF